jgi:anti-anti-sigma factor
MININRIDQQFIVSLNGMKGFTTNSFNEIEPVIKGLSNCPKTEIILNFASVQYVDSAGISLLIGLMEQAHKNGVVFSLSNLSPNVKELISLMKLEQTLKVLDF